MTTLPNSHQALLKCEHLLNGSIALLGVMDATLLTHLPPGGLAMSEHAGVFRQLEAVPDWQPLYGYEPPETAAGQYDTVVVFLAKAKGEIELRLALATWLAKTGGRIILVGEKKEGAARAGKQLQALIPHAHKADSVRHCQVWLADPVTHQPGFSVKDHLAWHPVDHQGIQFPVAGLPGIFSDGHLDEGTALLLDSLTNEPIKRGPVLDFACGAGVIGAWLQQWQRSQGSQISEVDGVDVQYQAVYCARETYEASEVTGEILASDGLGEITRRYSTILTNPPFHTGVKTDTAIAERFFQAAARHLQPGGELRLVANNFLGYEALMGRYVGAVRKLEGNRRFTVLSCLRR